jgi:hypothetical protein
MANYFVLSIVAPTTADYYEFEVTGPGRKKHWKYGALFSAQQKDVAKQPPPEPFEIRTSPDYVGPKYIYPEMCWHPIPLMSCRLVAALRDAGVDNLQTYETKLVTTIGENPPPENHYLAVNVVGLVAAADLAKSSTNPDVPDKMISMDFHSLAIDPTKTRDALMFRLAENISAVMVHERVKNVLDQAGFNTLTWYAPEDWAG